MPHNKLFSENFGKQFFLLKVDKCPYMYSSENGEMPLRRGFHAPSMFSRAADNGGSVHWYLLLANKYKQAEQPKLEKHFKRLAERAIMAQLYQLWWLVLAGCDNKSVSAYNYCNTFLNQIGFDFVQSVNLLNTFVGAADVTRQRAMAHSNPLFSERQLNKRFFNQKVVQYVNQKFKEL